MKNYFIDKYLTIYNKNKLQEIQHVQRYKVANLADALNFIKSTQINYVENKKGFSAYESYKILVKEDNNNYKIYYKEIKENGEIIQNV